MKKKKSLAFIIFLVVAIFLIGVGVYFLTLKVETKAKKYEDTTSIKTEYEALNNQKRESDGSIYQSVSIDDTIPVNILEIDETIEFLKEGTGILFIGAPWCPWCRNALPILMDVASSNDVTLNYIDITDIRNTYEIQNKKLVKTQEEKEGYYELLKVLDKVLGEDTYKLTDEDGKVYDTKEKRIYIPMAISVKNGDIQDVHVSTVDLDKGQTKYDKLTKEQVKKLENIYQGLINKQLGLNVCNSESLCD